MFACDRGCVGRTFLSLCRSASVSDCFRSMRCCHLRFSWLSSRCLPIATQYYWKGLPPLPGGTLRAEAAMPTLRGVAAARAEGEIRATLAGKSAHRVFYRKDRQI